MYPPNYSPPHPEKISPNSIYLGLHVVPMYLGTLGPKYLLYGYMDPQGSFKAQVKSPEYEVYILEGPYTLLLWN